MTDSQNFDSLIDAVARRMTAGDPPARLRPRVLARLDERRSMPWVWMTAGFCAVSVVAAVAIGLHDRAASRITPAGVARQRSTEPLASGPQILAPSPKLQTPIPVRREPRVTARAPSAEEIAWRGRAIPALQPPDPLALDEIQPVPLEIRPLVTTPLTVPAIGEDEDRNP